MAIFYCHIFINERDTVIIANIVAVIIIIINHV